MKKSSLINVFKGLIIGSTMLVPGVSGGSMAIILGIYENLIKAVSDFRSNKKGNLIFLILFVFGAGIGIFAFAKPLSLLIERYPKGTLFYFLGVACGGIPMIYKEAKVEKITIKHIISFLIGLGIVMFISNLNGKMTTIQLGAELSDYVYLVVAGVIAAVALVLPGISVSYLFLVIGLYNSTINAISQMEMSFLLPLAIGGILGVIIITKTIDYAIREFPEISYLIILGFVVGSIVQLFPGIPQQGQWFSCVTTIVLGYLTIQLLYKFESR